jgi:hypothetical protein
MHLRSRREGHSVLLPLLERRLNFFIPCVLFAGILIKCLSPFRSKLPWMIYMQDDFFYYLKVAQNLAQGNGSTFNGIVPTNGYHPLWFLILSGFSWFTASPRMVLGFIAVTAFIASIVTYFCCLRLISATGIRRLTAIVLASWMTIYAMRLFFYGMEVTLAIPVSLGVLCLIQNNAFWLRGWKQSFVVGLLISVMILSRLDTMLLAGLVLIFICVQPRLREQIKSPQLLGIAMGLIPLAIYFLLNRSFFHIWLPISGMAKQLKFNHHPTSQTWHCLYLFIPSFLAVFLPIPIGILLYPLAMKNFSAIQKALYPAALLFPLVYYFVLCCLSDWSIWPWYMYALRPAMCVAFVIFCTWQPLARILQSTAVTAILLAVFLGFLVTSRWRLQEPDLYAAAVGIQQFSLTHPGTYAIGDRAGRVGYLVKDPVIHLEGLVMDRTFLGYIQRQTPLRTVLDAYDVRYYIGTAYAPYNGCFAAVEPYQAGAGSPHMRGEFCEKPVAVFDSGGMRNVIFDLHPER